MGYVSYKQLTQHVFQTNPEKLVNLSGICDARLLSKVRDVSDGYILGSQNVEAEQ